MVKVTLIWPSYACVNDPCLKVVMVHTSVFNTFNVPFSQLLHTISA